jgi:hypothetical protein
MIEQLYGAVPATKAEAAEMLNALARALRKETNAREVERGSGKQDAGTAKNEVQRSVPLGKDVRGNLGNAEATGGPAGRTASPAGATGDKR